MYAGCLVQPSLHYPWDTMIGRHLSLPAVKKMRGSLTDILAASDPELRRDEGQADNCLLRCCCYVLGYILYCLTALTPAARAIVVHMPSLGAEAGKSVGSCIFVQSPSPRRADPEKRVSFLPSRHRRRSLQSVALIQQGLHSCRPRGQGGPELGCLRLTAVVPKATWQSPCLISVTQISGIKEADLRSVVDVPTHAVCSMLQALGGMLQCDEVCPCPCHCCTCCSVHPPSTALALCPRRLCGSFAFQNHPYGVWLRSGLVGAAGDCSHCTRHCAGGVLCGFRAPYALTRRLQEVRQDGSAAAGRA